MPLNGQIIVKPKIVPYAAVIDAVFFCGFISNDVSVVEPEAL